MKRSFEKFEAHLYLVGLHADIEKHARKQNITLRSLYEGENRAPSVSAARRATYSWLRARGKGVNEIARLFDREPSGVAKMLRNGGGR